MAGHQGVALGGVVIAAAGGLQGTLTPFSSGMLSMLSGLAAAVASIVLARIRGQHRRRLDKLLKQVEKRKRRETP